MQCLCRLTGLLFLGASLVAPALHAQIPEWIWPRPKAAAGETQFFRKQFNLPFEAAQAVLTADGDDEVTVFINGKEVARSTHWKDPVTAEVTRELNRGANVIAARGNNGAPGAAGVLVKLEVRSPNMSGFHVVSDTTWLCATNAGKGWASVGFDTNGWVHPTSLGKAGVEPWGDVFKAPQATPAESLALLPGFQAQLLHSARRDEGSWIAMCADDRGRFIISPEKTEAPFLRATVSPSGKLEKIEKLPLPLRGAMGLCWANGSLYANCRGPKGVGLYRVTDTNGNDTFDPGEERLLKHFEGDNEHGYHAVVPGPDGAIYVMNGNHTKVPDGVTADSPLRSYAEDLLLPRQWDANGHAKGVLAPGGYIVRTDPEGREWRLICGGFRNTYDFDFNTEGEIFTFDSDMEWDIGAPWYRPTRILHCVSGGEYGWRSGTGKWPVHYPDSLPAVVDIGLSSPTASKFGTRSNFPEKYRRALFAADWAYGKIFAVHLEPRGASYGGTFETFVAGKPLAVTALDFGRDGAMYFIIGGWKIQSGLYRVSYAGGGKPGSVPKRPAPDVGAPQRALRHQLESFHGRRDPRALETAWPQLGSPDRWLCFAARVAVESQDVSAWRQRALAENNLDASLTALLALARSGEHADQAAIIARLCDRLSGKLDEPRALDAARVLQLALIRLGTPDLPTARKAIETLSRIYPAPSEKLNRELGQILVYLDAPDVLPKTLALMAAAPTQEEQMHHAFVLRNVKHGWTSAQRRAYFEWFQKALAEYHGGQSFRPFLVNIRKDALSALTDAERAEVASLLENKLPGAWTPRPRQIVREWSFAELEPALAAGGLRSFQSGRQAFIDAQCMACHRVGQDGGSIGPELTGVSGRFGARDLLENILLPSKIISDRYQTYTISTRDGEEYSGFITDETPDKLVVIVNPLANTRQEIAKKEISSRAVAKTSAMPEGLVNVLSREEILDLVAFIQADGRNDPVLFKQSGRRNAKK